jgi:hypothetical protein
LQHYVIDWALYIAFCWWVGIVILCHW